MLLSNVFKGLILLSVVSSSSCFIIMPYKWALLWSISRGKYLKFGLRWIPSWENLHFLLPEPGSLPGTVNIFLKDFWTPLIVWNWAAKWCEGWQLVMNPHMILFVPLIYAKFRGRRISLQLPAVYGVCICVCVCAYVYGCTYCWNLLLVQRCCSFLGKQRSVLPFGLSSPSWPWALWSIARTLRSVKPHVQVHPVHQMSQEKTWIKYSS